MCDTNIICVINNLEAAYQNIYNNCANNCTSNASLYPSLESIHLTCEYAQVAQCLCYINSIHYDCFHKQCKNNKQCESQCMCILMNYINYLQNLITALNNCCNISRCNFTTIITSIVPSPDGFYSTLNYTVSNMPQNCQGKLYCIMIYTPEFQGYYYTQEVLTNGDFSYGFAHSQDEYLVGTKIYIIASNPDNPPCSNTPSDYTTNPLSSATYTV